MEFRGRRCIGAGGKLAGPTFVRIVGRPVFPGTPHRHRGFAVAGSFLRLAGPEYPGQPELTDIRDTQLARLLASFNALALTPSQKVRDF